MQEEVKEIKKKYYQEYRAKNKDRINATMRKWRANNKDKIKQYNANYWNKKASKMVEE